MEALKERAKAILRHTDADQVIVIRTTSGQVYSLENHHILEGDHSGEDTFLQMLQQKNDTRVESLVCMWDENAFPDMPSIHFRRGLLELNPHNTETGMLVMGDRGEFVRNLGVTVIPQKIDDLKERAEKLLSQTAAQQVIVVRAASGQLYSLENHSFRSGDHTDEAAFVQMLKEKGETRIEAVVCMEQGTVPVEPSAYFRRELAALNPENIETEILTTKDSCEIHKPMGLNLLYKNSDDMKQEAEKMLLETNAQQIIFVRSAANQVYGFGIPQLREDDHSEEDAFLQMLKQKNDTRINDILWLERGIDPAELSGYFRRELVRLNPNNIETRIIVLKEFLRPIKNKQK